MILKYNVDDGRDGLAEEQTKFLKIFSEKYISIQQDNLLSEVYVRKITAYSNVSARFIAYCLKREIYNLNYIFYLYHICSKWIFVPDKKGGKALVLKKTRGKVLFNFISFNMVIFIYTFYVTFVLVVDITSLVQALVNILINLTIVYLCFQSYKNLCFLELEANLEDVIYENLSNS